MRKNATALYLRLLRFRLQRYFKQRHKGAALYLASLIFWGYYFLSLLKLTLRKFVAQNTFRHAAALSYYTIFSLPPILLLLISGLGIFLGEADTQHKVMQQISALFGEGGKAQLAHIIAHFKKNTSHGLNTSIGFLMLLFTSTALFYTLKTSLNDFWKVPRAQKKGFKTQLFDRLIAFAMIILVGILQLIAIFAGLILTALKRLATAYIPDNALLNDIFTYSNNSISLLLTTLLFALLFKYLPDAATRWKPVWVGAIFTVLLFWAGKQLINIYIQNMKPGLTYGAAGSLIVILLWFFYSSLILFWGAQFTYVYTKYPPEKICKRKYRLFAKK